MILFVSPCLSLCLLFCNKCSQKYCKGFHETRYCIVLVTFINSLQMLAKFAHSKFIWSLQTNAHFSSCVSTLSCAQLSHCSPQCPKSVQKVSQHTETHIEFHACTIFPYVLLSGYDYVGGSNLARIIMSRDNFQN